jgi:dihydroflavonol-4-reductase
VQRMLVLGATGHIGQAVVRRALERGHQVTAVTRRAHPEPLRGLGVSVVRTDDNLRLLAGLAAGHDVLIDAAAPYPLAPDIPGGETWRRAVDGALIRMERVIEAARTQNMVLVYVSSCTTLPRIESPSEAAAAVWRRSISPYFEAKAAMERAVLGAAREGLRAVIVNPAACLGPWEYRETERSFVRSVLEQRLPGVLNRTMCVIDVRDVADAIERAVSREMFGRVIPLSGHNIPLPELANLTARIAGMTAAPPIPLDHAGVAASAYWVHLAFTAVGLAPPSGLKFIPLIADSIAIPRSAEQAQLGVTIRPLETTLRDAIAFHRQRPIEVPAQGRHSAG